MRWMLLAATMAVAGCGGVQRYAVQQPYVEPPLTEEDQAGYRQQAQNEAAVRQQISTTWHQQQAARVSSIRDHPSAALTAYEAKVVPLYRAWGLAGLAGQCGLRSDQWYMTMEMGLAVTKSHDPDYAALNEDERYPADLAGQNVKSKAAASETCATLVNSPTMDNLDRLHDQLTGGYR